MPIFEYTCPSCGLIEVLVMPGEKEVTLCPVCEEKGKKNKVSKAISASALSFKGSGFYITDYTSKGSSPSSAGASESSPSSGGSSSSSEGSDSKKAEPKAASEKSAKTEKKSESKKKK